MSQTSIADTTELEALIAQAKDAQQKAAEASDTIAHAEREAQMTSADDGSLSAVELVDRRDSARRKLEAAKIEYDRVLKTAEGLASEAESAGAKMIQPVSTALFEFGDRNREDAMSELAKNFGDEAAWVGYRTRYDIRSFVSEFDRVRLPLNLWKRVKDYDFRRFSKEPGVVLSRIENFVSLMKEARQFV